MYKKYNIEQTPSQKRGRVVPDFELIPRSLVPPIIKSQPVRNFIQYTFTDSNKTPIQVKPIEGSIIKLIKGTTIQFSVLVENPANSYDKYNTEGLVFVWKQNDSEIYGLSQLNNNRGTSQVYLEGQYVTPEINGTYVVEVTNAYGTTISDSFTISVIDPDTDMLLNTNILKDGNGISGGENWELGEDIIIKQFEDSIYHTANYASIYSGTKIEYDIATGEVGSRVLGEFPFTYCTSPNWINFREFYNGITTGLGYDKTKERVYVTKTPNLIINEEYTKPFAQLYPSPYTIDAYNKNNNLNVQGLVDGFSTLPTYFTRDKIKFAKDGGIKDTSITQTIDISNLADVIDGYVAGVNQVEAQFFGYLANGLTKYNYVVYELDANNKEIVSEVFNTYILDSANWRLFLEGKPFKKATLPRNVTRIEIVPIANDSSEVIVECLDGSSNPKTIKVINIKGPDSKDVFAVKERFFMSTYINKLFDLVVEKANKPVPVSIFGQKYFHLFDTPTTNKNQAWINKYYPKYKASGQFLNWENGKYTLEGLDKGAAAFFGMQENFNIPPKTRSIRITVRFKHDSKAYTDQLASVAGWDSSDIYEEHLQDAAWYEYNLPRIGATQMKLVLGLNKVEISDKYPTFFVPSTNVWKTNKNFLGQSIHNETLNLVYNTITNTNDVIIPIAQLPIPSGSTTNWYEGYIERL